MNDLLGYLRSFNRKERFYLIGMALGNVNFHLSQTFRSAVGDELGLSLPDDALVAMDYHLDWIYASLYLYTHDGAAGPHDNTGKIIRAQQEDIDLLIAYNDADLTHLILVEAKGESAWSNAQMASKVARFREIFGEAGSAFGRVAPHFLAVSPRRPRFLATAGWPAWMMRNAAIPWLPLPMGSNLVKVTRCTVDGQRAEAGTHWKVISA